MLSILIPSKNEPYLLRTIQDIERHAEGEIEILSREDYGIGQRALTNELAREARGEYVMKVDAHCSFSQGFDVDMLKKMDEKTIMAPRLLVLDAGTWTMQKPMTSAYCFDTELVMQYHQEAENDTSVNETMCLQGSAWMVAKKTYFDWNLGEEALGSWGHQGAELGIKAFLNGGRCVTNKLAFYGHLFRHDEKDFPYKRDKKEIKKTSKEFKKRYRTKAIAELIRKFNYPCDWSEEKLSTLLT